MKRSIATLLILATSSIMAVTITENTVTVKSGPDFYSDGTQILQGEIYMVEWTPAEGSDDVKKTFGPYAANEDGLLLSKTFSKDYTISGTIDVFYYDTRATATTLGNHVYAIYKSAFGDVANGSPAISTVSNIPTPSINLNVENKESSPEDLAATSAKAEITIIDGIPTFSVTNVTGNATILVESSTDLKTWTVEAGTTLRAFKATDIKIDSNAATKFFRVMKK